VAGVFILDVNAGSMLIFPMVVTADQSSAAAFVRLAGAHFLILLLGSLFTFCLCFSLMGVLVALAPGTWFGGFSIALRAGAGLGLLAMWMSAGRGHAWLPMTRAGTATWQEWVPPVWFASMYGPLAGRADLGVERLWGRGLWALGLVLLVALAGYGIGYRRGMEGSLVRSTERRRWPGWVMRRGANPLERAAFGFSLLTLWRSDRHSLLVIAVLGAGLVVGAMQGDASRIPFFAGYSLILALRMAFGVPAAAAANWPFRLLAVAEGAEPARVARRLLWLHAGVLVLAPTLLFCPWAVMLMAVLLHGLLIEVLLLDFRQIPFTVRAAGFRNTRLVQALLGLVGLLLVPWIGGRLAVWIEAMPFRAVVPVLAAGVLLRYRARAVEAVTAGQPPLVFEDREEEVMRLGL
jgi:hypothetical protein